MLDEISWNSHETFQKLQNTNKTQSINLSTDINRIRDLIYTVKFLI